MSNTETPLPSYDELVRASLRALDISTTILGAAEDAGSPEEATIILATAHLTVAGAQVFATLAQAAASVPVELEPVEAGSWGKPVLVPND